MNHGEMITQVQNLFGDTSEAQVTRAFITSMLNNGQLDVARKTKCLMRRSETHVESGTDAYELPDDFIQIESATIDGRRLTPIPKATLDEYDPTRQADGYTGSPTNFFTVGRTFFLYPTPSESGNANLDIWYVKRPVDLVDNEDESDLPISFHEDVVLYALVRCKQLDEEFGQAQVIQQDYEERLIESKNETWDERADSYPSVRLLPGDY